MKKVSILIVLLTLLLTACTAPMATDMAMEGDAASAEEAAATAEPEEEAAEESAAEEAESDESRITGAAPSDDTIVADVVAAHVAAIPASEAGSDSGQTRLTGQAQTSAQDGTLPLPAGVSIEQGRKYNSPSGGHYLIFQPDGNLVVYTSADGFVWGLNEITDKYAEAQSVQMGRDGNLVVNGADGAYIWSALTKDADARAVLDLTANGALQLVSDRSGVLWSSDGNLTADDHGTDCTPFEGWTHCQMLADPKIKIVGSKNVSQSAMDVVEGIYTDMTALFSEKYPKDKFDGYVIYITNGEPWSELSGVYPVGTMMGKDENGKDAGDFLRGGTGANYLWISEQMICKTGVATRENDTDERTFDQVIHEFGHAIDFNYGLRDRIQTVYAGGWNPVEQFPWSIQHWFGSPAGELPANENELISDIFSGTTTFSCDDYTP